MSAQWLRLWHDMPTDPKWRTIARVSGQTISAVIATYIHLLVTASNASERGRTHQANAEDLASALDMETSQIEAILTAMQGRVLDGDILTGWSSRQPEREDGSGERARKWREARKHAAPRDFDNQGSQLIDDERTQTNANERKRTQDTDTDTDTESIPPLSPPPVGEGSAKTAHGSRLPTDWQLPDDWLTWALTVIPDRRRVIRISESFRDHWIGAAGAKGRKADWQATWRNWIRREAERHENTGNRTPERESVVDRVARKNGFVRTDDGEFVRPEEVRDRATILDAHDGALRLGLV